MATAICEEAKKEASTPNEESQNIEKRGLHGSYGDWSGSSYSGGEGGGGGGGGHHHHEQIKTITIEKKYPVHTTEIKHIPYTVEKKVPYEVKASTIGNGQIYKLQII